MIDALALYANGFRNVIPIYGTQGFEAEHEALLAEHGVREVYLVLDADEPGRKAAELLSRRLADRGIGVHRLELPEKDPAAFFLRHTPEEMEGLLKRAHPKTLERSELVTKRGEHGYEVTPWGFKVTFGSARRYEVKGISRQTTQLKVTVQAEKVFPSSPSSGASEGDGAGAREKRGREMDARRAGGTDIYAVICR